MVLVFSLKSIVNITVKLFVLKKCILCFFGLLLIFLILSLITFDSFDDTYLQYTGNNFVHNICGKLGAICADILFFTFGCVAYFLSCMLFFLYIISLKNESLNFFRLSFKIFWCIILLLSLCGLMEFFVDDFYYCFSGGIVGNLLRAVMLHIFSDVTINIILFIFTILGMFLIFKSNKGQYLFCKKIFLNLKIRLEGTKSVFEIFVNKFHFTRSLIKIKNFQIKKISGIRNNDILQRIYYYINWMIYYVKYVCYTFIVFNIAKYLFFKKFRMSNSSYHDVSLSGMKSHVALNCGKLYNYFAYCFMTNFRNKVKQSQKLINSNCMIKQSLSSIHPAQVNRIEFCKKKRSL